MNHCNHGPSRFYRVSWPKSFLAFTSLCDWHDKLCATPETTVSCPINSNRCN